MSIKVILYAPEAAATSNPFVQRVLNAAESWESADRHNRSLWAQLNGQRVHRNEYGIGITLEHLPANTPNELRGTRLSAIIIEHDYLDDNGRLEPGMYKRGNSTALVNKRTSRPSDGSEPYVVFNITITGKSLKTSRDLYTAIQAGTVDPDESWSDETE